MGTNDVNVVNCNEKDIIQSVTQATRKTKF